MKKSIALLCLVLLTDILLFGCGNNKDELNALQAELASMQSDQERVSIERKSEEDRIAAEKESEEQRIAEEERIEAERIIAENIYEKRITSVCAFMRTKGLAYIGLHDSISLLWSLAIQNRHDFTEAINNFLDAIEGAPNIDEIYPLDHIADLMIEIQEPPEKFKDAYIALIEMYELFVQIAEQARHPTGSLQTYNSKTKDLATKFNSVYSKIQVLLPKVEDEEYIEEL